MASDLHVVSDNSSNFCPQCGHRLARTGFGWFCLECGYHPSCGWDC
ncbi:MAG: hypothetical protein IMW91_10415 [Firmicutes bacterium]|nr:hypothetical protein [Bacillota bacterium]